MLRSRGNWGTVAWSGLALVLSFAPPAAHGQAPSRPSSDTRTSAPPPPGADSRIPAPPPPTRGGRATAPTAGTGARAVPNAATTNPAAPVEGGNPLAPPPAQVGDLSTRFRLIERYTTTPEKADPADVSQYRVALRDVMKLVTENPQGAPDRFETTVQVIFTERPAVVNTSGVVTDTVRRYEAFRVTPPVPGTKPSAPRVLEGLTVWEKFHPGANPTITSLTPDRPLYEDDFRDNTRVVVLPELAAALPALPSRVGDRWRLPRNAANALLGDRPMDDEPLTGTLVDVHKTEKGTEMEAVIGVSGRVKMPPNKADTLLNAQLIFTFTPSAPNSNPAPGAATTTTVAPVEARGRITVVRLAKSSVSAVPGSNGRLRRTLTHELILQRPLADLGAPLAVPAEEPKPNLDNSWLWFVDPQDRYRFRHPQDLQRDDDNPEDDVVPFVRRGLGPLPEKVFEIKVLPKTGKAGIDRDNRDPEFLVKSLTKEWTEAKQEVIRGPSGWLPEADWSPYKLKVYRIEAALKLTSAAPRDAQRIFADYYLILTPRNETLVVTTMTPLDPPQAYREEVEQLLRTIKFETVAATPKPAK